MLQTDQGQEPSLAKGLFLIFQVNDIFNIERRVYFNFRLSNTFRCNEINLHELLNYILSRLRTQSSKLQQLPFHFILFYFRTYNRALRLSLSRIDISG